MDILRTVHMMCRLCYDVMLHVYNKMSKCNLCAISQACTLRGSEER